MAFFHQLFFRSAQKQDGDGTTPSAQAAPEEKRNVMTLAEAVAMFNELADMADIAFGFIQDGCAARAHIMGEHLMAQGWAPGKAWAVERPHHSLYVIQPPENKVVEWWFHVAPSMDVEMPDGQVMPLVFDPSLFDGPAGLQEWGSRIHAEPERVEVTKWQDPPRDWNGNYTPRVQTDAFTDRFSHNTMQNHLQWQSPDKRIVHRSLCRALLETQTKAPPPPAADDHTEGQTWISDEPADENEARLLHDPQMIEDALNSMNTLTQSIAAHKSPPRARTSFQEMLDASRKLNEKGADGGARPRRLSTDEAADAAAKADAPSATGSDREPPIRPRRPEPPYM